MSQTSENHLYQHITARYLLALAIIVVLSTGAWYTLKTALLDTKSTAYIVNISGRQRMLSQHIALDIHRLNPHIENTHHGDEQLIPRLQTMINDMRDANRQLSSGSLANGEQIDLSPAVRDMLFGTTDLSQRVIEYTNIAHAILATDNTDTYLSGLVNIDQMSEPLLRDLNALVNLFQEEGEASLARIKDIETLVWLLTMLALLMEIFFIFRPMVNEILIARQEQQDTLDNLHNLVELRTIKLERANDRLKEMIKLDPLTHLFNRLTLEADIENLIKGFQSNRVDFALCMLDIDWFKSINDNYGHLVGDSVLKQLAKLFKDFTRDTDKVYRSGGEEFVILLNRIDLEHTLARIEKLRGRVKQHIFTHEEINLQITISIGVFHSSLFAIETVHQALQSADNALYRAKNQGRDQVTLAEK